MAGASFIGPSIFEKIFENSSVIYFGNKPEMEPRFIIGEADTDHFRITKTTDGQYFLELIANTRVTYLDRDVIVPGIQYPLPHGHVIYSLDGRVPMVWAFDSQGPYLWRLPANKGVRLTLTNVGLKVLDGHWIIKKVNLDVRQGEFIAVYGKSGSGKTTLTEVVLGLNSPSDGHIAIDGRPLGKSYSLRDDIAFLPQRLELPKELSCTEFFNVCAASRKISLKQTHDIGGTYQQAAMRISGLPQTPDFLNRRIAILSGGEYRRLCLAATILHGNSRLLVVDEPSAGLDPSVENEIYLALKRLSRHGVTVLAVTHAPFARSLVDRLLVLHPDYSDSSIVYCGPWNEEKLLKEDPALGPLSSFERFIRILDRGFSHGRTTSIDGETYHWHLSQ